MFYMKRGAVDINIDSARASSLELSDDSLLVELVDGRTVCLPLEWYPRLVVASKKERENYIFLGSGEGINWPDLDEDILVGDLLIGNPSKESLKSYEKWLSNRKDKN